MKKYYLGIIFVLTGIMAMAQVQRAYLQEDGRISIDTIHYTNPIVQLRSNNFRQMDGFPKKARANKTFKNFRNVSLADINGDQKQDILWGADNQLFAHSDQQLLWQTTVSGTLIYPPSVADLDQDGALDIVQATGGSQTASRIYLLDTAGQNQVGWPLNFDGNWIITAPALADVDGNDTMEIIFNERDSPASKLHIVGKDGKSFSANWPQAIEGTLAVTPSIGDVDGDGQKEIYVASSTTRYLIDLNGQIESGWPRTTAPLQRYSFQSPLLSDLNGDGDLEIMGATHGDIPQFYILQADGSNYPGWPVNVPEGSWTFNTPTLVDFQDTTRLFMSRPIGDFFADMLYGWNEEGKQLPEFPLEKTAGLEGIISVADVDGDDEYELLFGSNLLLPDGTSFIHAYEMNGEEVAGFPIFPKGWTFMNGINIGDINGDQKMDLVALTYTQSTNPSITDSIFLNVYELQVPYSPESVLWSTYKGNNKRDGLIEGSPVSSITKLDFTGEVNINPNPVSDNLQISLSNFPKGDLNIYLYNSQGQLIKQVFSGKTGLGNFTITTNMSDLPAGIYNVRLWDDNKASKTMKIIKH